MRWCRVSVFNRLSRAEITRKYTHRGWFGPCPVYFLLWGTDGVEMIERNWVPTWWLGAATVMHNAFNAAGAAVSAAYEPRYVVLQTGVIRKRAL